MKNCPKCNSEKVMESIGFQRMELHKVALSLTESRDSESFFHFRTPELFELFAIVCGECGYAEMHAENPEKMWRLWEKGYR